MLLSPRERLPKMVHANRVGIARLELAVCENDAAENGHGHAYPLLHLSNNIISNTCAVSCLISAAVSGPDVRGQCRRLGFVSRLVL